MRLLYGIGIGALYSMMWLASLFNAKAKKWIHGQRQKISGLIIPEGKPVVWFHCASLGEFDQGLPVMNAYKNRFPEAFLVVTFFSPSGMEFYHKRNHRVDLACYLPLDTASNAKKFIAQLKPQHVFFVKYEFWYNHMKAAKKSGANVYGVSSLFRPTHRFFQWYGGFFRKALRLFDHFFVQDERSGKLLRSIGISQVTITGDTRYDRMVEVRSRNEANTALAEFTAGEPTLILGSSWPVDEENLKSGLEELQQRMKIIVAPHDVSEAHITAILDQFQGKATRYTQYQTSENRILILDTIGHLTSAYRYATIAYVGGGFTGKLHNILEPGAFGIPVIFGPKHERFPEAQLFLDRGVALEITGPDQFEERVETLLKKKDEVRAELTKIFAENSGVAKKVVRAL
jgi:3-deoxy-D-manno-octulosonic-acid transferase